MALSLQGYARLPLFRIPGALCGDSARIAKVLRSLSQVGEKKMETKLQQPVSRGARSLDFSVYSRPLRFFPDFGVESL